jgi:hypothetical protein
VPNNPVQLAVFAIKITQLFSGLTAQMHQDASCLSDTAIADAILRRVEFTATDSHPCARK